MAETQGNFPLDVFESIGRPDLVKQRRVQAGEELLSKGSTPKFLYFVLEGCLRSYVIDEKGKEHTLLFAPEGWLLADQESYVENKPSRLFIEAIENSLVAEVPADKMREVINSDPKLLRENLDKLNRRTVALQRRLISQLSATAEERYVEFIETYPGLARRLPLKLIASYLGITPESLSRVRREIATRR